MTARLPSADIWKGLPAKADDTAVAEHALRAIVKAQAKSWTKSDLLGFAAAVVAGRWGGYHCNDIRNLVRASPAVNIAFNRLVAAGVFVWIPRKPPNFNI
jgi:hypothetical protein